MFDLSRDWSEEDERVCALARTAPRAVALANKSDLPPRWDAALLRDRFDAVCVVSARDGSGLDELSQAVRTLCPPPEAAAGEILTNTRQRDAIARAEEYLAAAAEAMRGLWPPDAVLTECEGAMGALSELTGRLVREDVTERIFSRFCVGK